MLYMQRALLCKAFSNEYRVRLIQCLEKPKNVSALLQTCDLSQSALSQHLKILRDSGVVTCHKKGKEVIYQTANKRYTKIAELLLTN